MTEIGNRMAGKVFDILDPGRLVHLARERGEIPSELSSLLEVDGLGPRMLRRLHDELGVRKLADLEAALADGRAVSLRGFGARTCEKLGRAIDAYRRRSGRFRLADVERWAESLRARLLGVDGARRVEVAGSFRRRRETVGRLDILCTAANGSRVADAFVSADGVEEILARGTTRSSVRLRTGMRMDLRIVPEESFGAALHYFTGSRAHGYALRALGRQRGYRIDESGAFRGERRVAGRTEEEIFALVGASFVPPELREDRGEIEAAIAGTLPRLVELDHLRGDLQIHTTATDGRDDAEAMAEAARALGREYVAITEHSKAVRVTGGLDERELHAYCVALRGLHVPGIRLLTGIEVDILRDGSLDLAPEALRGVDVVVGSVHSDLDLPRGAMTRRVVRAVESGLIHILGHPTGRLIGERQPIDLDMEAVIEACLRHGVALEINAQPSRLDLSDVHARLARDMGASLVISSDARSARDLGLLRFGVDVARRAWVGPERVLNTLPVDELLARLHREY